MEGAYSFLACLSRLIIDHASISRRSTVPPPIFGRSLRFFHILRTDYLLILPPSCFAVCGHRLSPRIAVVFSLLFSLLTPN